jgi:hypothetical protein
MCEKISGSANQLTRKQSEVMRTEEMGRGWGLRTGGLADLLDSMSV